MGKMLCKMTSNHKPVKPSIQQEGGTNFRFVLACRCGERKIVSEVLNENDLLANISLHQFSFPVDLRETNHPLSFPKDKQKEG